MRTSVWFRLRGPLSSNWAFELLRDQYPQSPYSLWIGVDGIIVHDSVDAERLTALITIG